MSRNQNKGSAANTCQLCERITRGLALCKHCRNGSLGRKQHEDKYAKKEA